MTVWLSVLNVSFHLKSGQSANQSVNEYLQVKDFINSMTWFINLVRKILYSSMQDLSFSNLGDLHKV